MNLRVQCGCGAWFTTSDALCGQMVRCPECRQTIRVPDASAAGQTGNSAADLGLRGSEIGNQRQDSTPATWWARAAASRPEDETRPSPWKWAALVLLLAAPAAIVAGLLLFPHLRASDPREQVAARYLDAVCREDWTEANRLSVISDHPRLRSVERVAMDDQRPNELRGKFQGLREFHTWVSQNYRYNADRGRFEPKDELGLGLSVLQHLEQGEKKIKEQAAERAAQPARRKQSFEDQLLDDALSRYGVIGELAKQAGGLLSTQRLGPTYADLLAQTSLPLSDAERSLAELYSSNAARMDRLLGRPFIELPDLGEFVFEEVPFRAVIHSAGPSLAEPGRTITLKLVRFSLGSIDSGWLVWEAQ